MLRKLVVMVFKKKLTILCELSIKYRFQLNDAL